MRRLAFAEPAACDLDDILDYIGLDDPKAAERVYQFIRTSAEQLMRFPEMGRVGRLPATRELAVASLPYVIVYEVGSEAVTILAVFHGARDLAHALAERRAGRRP